MKKLTSPLITFLIAILMLSCKDDDVNKIEEAKSLVVGQWNSYEMGSQATGFIAGRETLITIIYASGIAFFEDGSFGMRFYDDLGWNEDVQVIGTYEFKNDKTIDLLFNPTTADEYKLELQIIKLNSEHFWFQHKYWVNDQNPNPTEHHLERGD